MDSVEEGPTLETLEGQAWQVLRNSYLRVLCHDGARTPIDLTEDEQNELLAPFFPAMEHDVGIIRELLVQAAGVGQEIMMARLHAQTSDPAVLQEILEGAK